MAAEVKTGRFRGLKEARPLQGLKERLIPTVLFNPGMRRTVNRETPEGKIPIEDARAIVDRISPIIGVSGVRNRFFSSRGLQKLLDGTGAQPVDLILTQRLLQLQEPELVGFWEKMLTSDAILQGLLQSFDDAGDKKAPRVDPKFSTQEDIVVSVLKEVFKDEEVLLPELMKASDARVTRSSQENIQAIEEADGNREIIQKDVILVGGGPITSLVASILSPFRNVTIISDKKQIGYDWRYLPIFTNSSVKVDDPMAARFPLAGGTTTPSTMAQSANMPDTDMLLNGNTFKAYCADGSIREYPAGENLGNFVAMATTLATADFLLEHFVNPEQLSVLPNGKKRVEIKDLTNGSIRQLDANAVFFVPGPGKEVPKFEDEPTRALYKIIERSLTADIASKKNRINRLGELIAEYRSKPTSEYTRGFIAAAEKELSRITVTLPQILSLSMFRQIYEFWEFSLVSGPKPFPLAPLFDKNVSIADIGGEDSSRVFEEFVNLIGPRTAYPESYKRRKRRKRPQTTMFNETAQTVQEYQVENRRRYSEVFTKRTKAVGEKVKAISLVTEDGKQKASVQTDSATALFDYAFVGTGLQRDPIEKRLPFDTDKLLDSEGRTAAVGNDSANVAILGAGSGLKLEDLSAVLQRTIDVLGIPTNTISLWVHALLAERYIWSWLEKNGPDKSKVQKLIELSGRKVQPAEVTLDILESRSKIKDTAEEVQRLYEGFEQEAVPFSDEYIQKQLAGEQGVTWDFYQTLFGRVRFPILPPVARRDNEICLGIYVNNKGYYRNPYYLQQGKGFLPEYEGETFSDENQIRVHEAGLGFDPGQDYIIIEGRIFKARVEQGSGMYSRAFLSDKYRELTELEPALVKLIENVQGFEKERTSAAVS